MPDFSKPEGSPPPDPNQPRPGSFPPPPSAYPPGPQPGYGAQPGPQPGYGGPPGPQPGYGVQPGPQSGYGPQPGFGPPGYGPGPGYGPPPGGLAFPPGVELASHGRRIGAYFLAVPLLVVTLVVGYLIWGLVVWGKGTSPSLKVLKMKCVDVNTGQVVGFGKMALRDIVGGIVQGILSIITLIISFVMFLATEKRQSLPDTIASTVVVYDPNNVMG